MGCEFSFSFICLHCRRRMNDPVKKNVSLVLNYLCHSIEQINNKKYKSIRIQNRCTCLQHDCQHVIQCDCPKTWPTLRSPIQPSRSSSARHQRLAIISYSLIRPTINKLIIQESSMNRILCTCTLIIL